MAAASLAIQPAIADFGNIYEVHREYVQRIAARYVHDQSEAEDIAQESFTRAYAAFKNYRGDASISTWLTRIVINTAIETLRAGKRKVFANSIQVDVSETEDTTPTFEFHDMRPSPERRFSAAQQVELVAHALTSLSRYQRTVFELRFFHEKSLNEIAAITGRSVSSTKTAIFRARAHVVAMLEDSCSAKGKDVQ